MSVRMTEEEIWGFVGSSHVGILTTLRRDGIPIALPMWFLARDRAIYFETWGKKIDRIRRDPRATFLVESGTRWQELKAVHFVGKAEIIEIEDVVAIRAEIAQKYDAYRVARERLPERTRQVYSDSPRAVIRFEPTERTLNWDNSRLLLS